MWIKVRFPYDKVGEGVWRLCDTPYLRRLWNKHHKLGKKGYPTARQDEAPTE